MAKITDQDRQHALRLWTDWDIKRRALQEAVKQARLSPIWQKYDSQIAELERAREAVFGLDKMESDAKAALEVAGDYPVHVLVDWDDDDERNHAVRICALTGKPICEEDAVLEDTDTGELFIRDAIPAPSSEEQAA